MSRRRSKTKVTPTPLEGGIKTIAERLAGFAADPNYEPGAWVTMYEEEKEVEARWKHYKKTGQKTSVGGGSW